MRRDSRSRRESPRLLPFPARFSFLCWPYEDGGLAALAPLRGAKASAAAAPARPGGQWRPGFGRESSGRPGRHPPMDALRFAEPHSFTRGRAEAWNRPRNQWRAKPQPPCTACRLRGVQGPPWSIFGHFLLIKKVATQASDVCLTISQTTALPMAQGKTSPAFRSDRSITRMKAQRSDSLWPLSFGQESGILGPAGRAEQK